MLKEIFVEYIPGEEDGKMFGEPTFFKPGTFRIEGFGQSRMRLVGSEEEAHSYAKQFLSEKILEVNELKKEIERVFGD